MPEQNTGHKHNKYRHHVPPPDGQTIKMNVGDSLTLIATEDCNFTCTIGQNFDIDIRNVNYLNGSENTYTALVAGKGTYKGIPKSKSESKHAEPDSIVGGHSIQINPPPIGD